LRKSNVHARIHEAEVLEVRNSREEYVENVDRFHPIDSSVLKIPAKFNSVTRKLFREAYSEREIVFI